MGFAVVCLNRLASVGNEPVSWLQIILIKTETLTWGLNRPKK